MSEGLPKVNVAAAVAVPLAAASQGVQAVAKLAEKHQISAKFAKVGGLKDHKIVALVIAQKELLLAVLGLVLVFHGAQFKNIFLCTQLVITFLLTRFKNSISTIYEDLRTVTEKADADAPEPQAAKEAASAEEEKSKHAKKRDAKKADKEKVVSSVDPSVHLEAAKKLLKALDSDRLTNATKEVLLCFMACLLVIHGGLAQHVAVAHALVALAAERAEALLHFEGFDEIKPWTMLMLHFVLWSIMLPMSMFTSNLALILNCAFAGAQLASTRGASFLNKIGKLPDAEAFGSSVQGLAVFGGLVGAGFFWQSWTLASGGGLYWIFWLAYLPAVIVEAILGCL